MTHSDGVCTYCLCPAIEYGIRPACASHPLSYDLDGDWDEPCSGCGVVPRDLVEFRLEHLTMWRDYYSELWDDLALEANVSPGTVDAF